MPKYQVFLVFDDDMVVLLFLFLDLEPHIEVLDLDLLCKDLHLGMTFGCLLKVLSYLPRHLLLQCSYRVRVLQKLSLGLTQLRIYILVLPQ